MDVNSFDQSSPGARLTLDDFKACVLYFYQIFIFSPNDSPLETMRNVFYFSFFGSQYIQIFVFFPFLSTRSWFKKANGSGIIYDVMNWLA